MASNPDINYLWLGSPTRLNPEAIPGHDVYGPIMVARQLQKQELENLPTNKINFWCLEEYRDYFRILFESEGVSINVRAIETHLHDEISQGELAEEATYVLNYFTQLPDRSIINMVAFKDLFSIFLLNSQPGYVLDTNVQLFAADVPLGSKASNPIILPELDNVAAAQSPNGSDRGDFYFMYSPKRKHPAAQSIYNEWVKKPGIANLPALYKSVSNLTLHNLMFNLMLKTPPYGLMKFSYKSYDDTLDENKGLYRFLYNTALLESKLRFGNIDEQRPCLFSAIAKDNLAMRNIKDGTLLHHAVMTNNTAVVKLLLSSQANLLLTATYIISIDEEVTTKSFTAFELARFLVSQKLIEQDIVSLFQHAGDQLPVKNSSPSASPAFGSPAPFLSFFNRSRDSSVKSSAASSKPNQEDDSSASPTPDPSSR